MESPNYKNLPPPIFYAWEKGLKTGMYYLRSRPAVDPIKFTVDLEKAQKTNITTEININTDKTIAPIYEGVANAQQNIYHCRTCHTRKTIEERAAEFGMSVEEFVATQKVCSLETPENVKCVEAKSNKISKTPSNVRDFFFTPLLVFSLAWQKRCKRHQQTIYFENVYLQLGNLLTFSLRCFSGANITTIYS